MQYVLSESDREYRNEFYTSDIGAHQIHSDGRPVHTFRTQTVLVDGNNIVFDGCTFENTAGPGEVAGQAIALYLDGDNITYRPKVRSRFAGLLFWDDISSYSFD